MHRGATGPPLATSWAGDNQNTKSARVMDCVRVPQVLNGSLMKKEIFAILKYPYTKYLKTPTGENVAYMKNSRKYLNQELGDSGGSSATYRDSAWPADSQEAWL